VSDTNHIEVLRRLCDACLSRRLTAQECGEFYDSIQSLNAGASGGGEWPTRWFASGPQGEFFTTDHAFAEMLIFRSGMDRDEWTITDLSEGDTCSAPASPAMEDTFSICSEHQERDPKCSRCNVSATPQPEAARGEPVHQIRQKEVVGGWFEVSADNFRDYAHPDSRYEYRVLYTAPQPEAARGGWVECGLVEIEEINGIRYIKDLIPRFKRLPVGKYRLAAAPQPQQHPVGNQPPPDDIGPYPGPVKCSAVTERVARAAYDRIVFGGESVDEVFMDYLPHESQPQQESGRDYGPGNQAHCPKCSHCMDDRWMKDGSPCPECNRNGRSGHAHSTPPAHGDGEGVDDAYAKGWRECAKWADREDLIADIGSPAYERDKAAALATRRGGANG